MVRNHQGNFVKSCLQAVVSEVTNSLDKISYSDVSNTLQTGYLEKEYSLNDSYITRPERYTAMIQQEID